MKEKLQLLINRIDLLSIRERALLLLLSLAVIYFIWFLVLDNPLQSREKQLRTTIQNKKGQIVLLNQQAAAIRNAAKQGPSQHLVMQKNLLTQQLNHFDKKIAGFDTKIISANKLTLALQQLLSQSRGVKLLSFRSTPASSVDQSEENKNKLTEYRFQLVLEGSYVSVVHVLQKLEAMRWLILWDQLNYQVTKYPVGKVTVKLHTLSVNK